ncbi:hypothetical protein EV144_101697 [Flavobacterium sp. 270]|nr:hypothetical protein EV144_101697 [Flavobacterium sp. 270]
MELTVTFFIEFAFGLFIILDLFLTFRNNIKLFLKFTFNLFVNLFQKKSPYVSCLFSTPSL